jgi:hypothetical protein
MHTAMKREIPTTDKNPPRINLGHMPWSTPAFFIISPLQIPGLMPVYSII